MEEEEEEKCHRKGGIRGTGFNFRGKEGRSRDFLLVRIVVVGPILSYHAFPTLTV